MSNPHDLYVHPQALCESSDVGVGTRVWAFAHVMQGARVGRNCNICAHSFIEAGAVVGDGVTVKNGVSVWEGVSLEDNVFVGPNVAFTNDPNPRVEFKKSSAEFLETVVEEGASLGANATLLCGLTVGRYALVGAGSVVTGSVSPHAVVTGNPARQVGWVCRCASRLDDALKCSCGRSYAIEEGSGRLVESGA